MDYPSNDSRPIQAEPEPLLIPVTFRLLLGSNSSAPICGQSAFICVPQGHDMIGRALMALPVHQSNKIARHDPISLVAGLISDGFQSSLIKLPNGNRSLQSNSTHEKRVDCLPASGGDAPEGLHPLARSR